MKFYRGLINMVIVLLIWAMHTITKNLFMETDKSYVGIHMWIVYVYNRIVDFCNGSLMVIDNS